MVDIINKGEKTNKQKQNKHMQCMFVEVVYSLFPMIITEDSCIEFIFQPIQVGGDFSMFSCKYDVHADQKSKQVL